ncbi:MAG: AraC family transcriptional regulator [Acidimicrobiales bacterium]|nr:AraC family transcriptional regulator [Acidimicrobiales bacterium]
MVRVPDRRREDPIAPEPDVRRSPAGVVVLAELAAEHGVDATGCLSGTGLVASDLADPHATIAGDQELGVIRNLLAALPDVPGLGLRAGLRYHLTTHGIWGFALASSPDLRRAIDFGLRYLDLTFAFTRIGLEEVDGEARITIDDAHLPDDVRPFLVEREGASIVAIQRDLLSAAIPLRRLESTRPEPPHADLYEEVFGVRPLFGADANRGVFDAALLDLPMPQANELTARACEEQCAAILAQRRVRDGIAGQVRRRLAALDGPRSMADVARELNVSPRTLRRRLDAEGTSFRALAEEVTVALTEELLADPALTVDDIAARLGYADGSSLTRAFVRVHGVPPGRYRLAR